MDSQIPHHAPDFELQAFENELLLYHPAKTETFYLNPQAALIWRMCDGASPIDDIIDQLEAAYPDHRKQIRGDVIRTIRQFVKKGILILG